MPEGPEVAIVTIALKRYLEGKMITKIDVPYKRYDDVRFHKSVPCEISLITCKGKQIFFHLKHNHETFFVNSRLGMAGRWRITPDGNSKHTKVDLTLSDGSHIYFDETRPFGCFKYMTCDEYETKISEIGINPLIHNIEPIEFERIIKKEGRKKVCDMLMNQKYISGIGNYLKCEILYHTKILPWRRVNTLKNDEVERLYINIHKIPRDSFSYGGLTISDFWSPDGSRGVYPTVIYGKTHDPNGYRVIKNSKTKRSNERTDSWVEEIQI